MNQEAESMSKSKKRRLRRKNLLKIINNNVKIEEIHEENTEVSPEIDNVKTENDFNKNLNVLKTETDTNPKTDTSLESNKPKKFLKEEYKIESPKELKFESVNSTDKRLKAKSKSLDDDDFFKISELSENSETEDKYGPDNKCIISEASSEENLLDDLPSKSNLTPISLTSRNEFETTTKFLISPEEEKELRHFLGGLNLVNSPEQSVKEICEKSGTQKDTKSRRTQNRKELEQYFLPMCQNPRFLDAISEEASDLSDRECSEAQHLKQGTPDLDLETKPEKTSEVPTRKGQNRILKKMCNQVEQEPAILIETKLVEPIEIRETVCSSQVVPENVSNVEVVFISDSGSSNTSSGDFSDVCLIIEDSEKEKDIDKGGITSENIKSDKNITENNDFETNITEKNNNETSDGESSLDMKNLPKFRETETLETKQSSEISSSIKILENFNSKVAFDSTQLTPPPTPKSGSPKNEKVHDGSPPRTILFDYTKIPNILTTKELGESCLKKTVTNSITTENKNATETQLKSEINNINTELSTKNVSQSSIECKETITDIQEKRTSLQETKSIMKESAEDRCRIENLSKFMKNDVFKDQKYERYVPVVKEVETALKVREENKKLKKSQEKLKLSQNEHISTPPTTVARIEMEEQKNCSPNIFNSIDSICETSPVKEHIIPIDILTKSSEKTNLKNEHSIPIHIEKSPDKSDQNTQVVKEQIIPVHVETELETNKPIKPPEVPPRKNRSQLLKKNCSPKQDTLKERIIPVQVETKTDTCNINKENTSKEHIVTIELENKEDNAHKEEKAGSPAFSESSSSSENSSVSTAKFVANSSIADVTTLVAEEENPPQQLFEPDTLRNLVLSKLVQLPYGLEVLKELADVSKKLDEYTSHLPFKGLTGHVPAFIMKDDKNRNFLAQKMSQDVIYSKESHLKRIEEENKKLYHLQQNFCLKKSGETHFEEGQSSRNLDVTSPYRLLSIIKEEPADIEKNVPNNYLFYEHNSQNSLKSQNLDEWLTLTGEKSKSTSNLSNTDYSNNNSKRNEVLGNSNSIRRRSLPQEMCEKQLRYIMEKEMEIQRELEWLEEEKRKIQAELAPSNQRFQMEEFKVSKKGDFAERKEKTRPVSMPVIPTEFFRQQMYEEYLDKFSERQERKQHKVLKISSSNDLTEIEKQIRPREVIHPIEIEEEFMKKVREKMGKRDKISLEKDDAETNYKEESHGPPILILDGTEVKQADTLPKHLQEVLDDLTATSEDDSIWSPGQQQQPSPPPRPTLKGCPRSASRESQNNDQITPVWTPKSANSSPVAERKEFRPVNFQSPVLGRKARTVSETTHTPDSTCSEPPWRFSEGQSQPNLHLSSKDIHLSSTTSDRRFPTSQSTPGFGSLGPSPRLPRAQNPTITLLQKAREGQLPRGAHYLEPVRPDPLERKVVPKPRVPVKLTGDYHIKSDYESDYDIERPSSMMTDHEPRKYEGLGPTTNDGMPLILRSEIKEKDQSTWYKKMYDTIHKQKPARDEYVTIRYKQKRAQYPYSSGYLSEPEPGCYDSDFSEYKYQTLDRRRAPQANYYYDTSTMPRSNYVPDKSYSSSDIVKNTVEKYDNKPGKIENYTPGKSSISDKEAKRWWDEVMDIFDGHLEQQKRVPSFSQPHNPKSFINQALKESGYESDSTLVFRRKEDAMNLLSPKEQKEAYKSIQKGGDVPFKGLRKPAPDKPKDLPGLQDLSPPPVQNLVASEGDVAPPPPPPPPPPKSHPGGVLRSLSQESPKRYVENQVNIHYKTPVRQEIKKYVSEDELAQRQAEQMKKIYEEERKRKYLQPQNNLQELQDMKSRRHTDNFIPSQKSPISLNRYDDFEELTPTSKTKPRSPEPRLVAKALYNFVGQTSRELTFRKGDLIYVRRQIDKNWYEGELNAMVGLFPTNYVEIVPYEGIRTTTRKAYEGQARAKYNFLAQTHLELSLAKGELVTITRRVDDNWFEGKIGGRKGIFPVSYVEVLIDPSDPPPPSTKPVASPAAHSLLLNGSSQGKASMGTHLYTPIPTTPHPPSYHAKPVQLTGTGTYSTLPKSNSNKNPLDQQLRIETQSEPIPYRALYKYTPQNDDELELLENDVIYVLEKCDDGWFVGSSERTGAFGTFPGNYVEKVVS